MSYMRKQTNIQGPKIALRRTVSTATDPQDLKLVRDLQKAESSGKIPQIGQICTFVFNITTLLFLHIDESLITLAEVESEVFLNKPLAFFFSSLSLREHLNPVEKLLKKSFLFIKDIQGPYPVVNLEYNIQLGRRRSKRMIFQYTLHPGGGQHPGRLAYGKLVDISHLVNDGPPKLQILQSNKVIYSSEVSKEEMLLSSGIDLNRKDLTVLSMQSKGIRVRDIADKMGMSELSIYSMIRDMKRKTGLETMPLVQMLCRKGLLD